MKKILFLLLLSVTMYGQVPADATPLENIQITNNTTSTTATKVNVQEADGVINTIAKADLVNVVEVNDVPFLPLIGEAGKIYVVKNVNKIYRWNGTFYSEIFGAKGDKGDKGDQGLQGFKGDTGLTGADGAMGSQGPQGIQGIQGETGLRGIQGETGPQGPIGFTGQKGADGTGVSIKGSFDNTSQLPASGTAGDAYLISGNLHVWNGTTWVNVGNIQGPQGLIGLTGATGSQGIQGVKGDKGDQGIQGIQGLKGDTGAKGDTGSFNGDITADQVTETATRKFQTPMQSANNDATSSIQGQLNSKEPAFSKNTAFNKNFGIAASTVAEGNDSRFTDSRNPLPNSANYIQNQNTSAQSANMWISGTGKFGSSVTASQFFKPFSGTGTIASPFYEPLAIYGLATSNLAGLYAGNSFGADDGTFLKLRVNGSALANTPIDALTILPSGAATFASTVIASPATTDSQLPTLGQVKGITDLKVDKVAGKSLISDSEITRLSTVVNQDISGKENSFAKNTAFNKNFGATASTVAEGNDSRINNGQAAFGWGNHTGLYSTTTGSNINQASFRIALGLGSNAYTSTVIPTNTNQLTNGAGYVTDISNKVDKVTGKSLLSDTEITRLGTLVNYTHPTNHPPSIITQDSSNRFVSDTEKATWNGKISGSGTTNYIPKFSESGTVGNSSLFDNGTSIGLGTSSPQFKLDTRGVVGSIGDTNGFSFGDFTTAKGLFSIKSLSGRIISFDDDFSGLNVATLSTSGSVLNSTLIVLPATTDAQVPTLGQVKGITDLKVDKVAGKSLISDSEITRLATVTNQDISGKFDKTGGTISGNVNVTGTVTATSFNGSATLTGTPTAPTAAAGTNTTQIATTAFVQNATITSGTITTSTSITTATTVTGGESQRGKTILIDNGAGNINYTINAELTASFVKGGTGTITFVQGSGRTLVAPSGLIFNGIQGSTASVTSFGTTDYVYINNF